MNESISKLVEIDKVTILELTEISSKINELTIELGTFKRTAIDKLEKEIDKVFITACKCVICKSLFGIPVKCHWFSCSLQDKDGRISCNVPFCMDCVVTFFELDKPINTRSIQKCPICRSVSHSVPQNKSQVLTINEQEMIHIDDFITMFSNGQELVECIKCGKWVHIIRDLFNHRIGNGIDQCSESIALCNSCNKRTLLKHLTNGSNNIYICQFNRIVNIQ